MNKPLTIIGLLIALIGVNGIFFILAFTQKSTLPKSSSGTGTKIEDSFLKTLEKKELSITTSEGTSQINVYLSKTEAEHYHGLSNTQPLSQNEGMLFVYPNGGIQPRYVMRDMNYALDISFFDKDGKGVSAHRNLSPCTPTACPEVGPTTQTSIYYVLETTPRNQEIVSITPIE